MACDESTWRLFDDKLINVVKNYHVLYDITLKDFKNTTTNDNTWAEVWAEVSHSVKLMCTTKVFHSPMTLLQTFNLRPVFSPAIIGNPNLTLTLGACLCKTTLPSVSI